MALPGVNVHYLPVHLHPYYTGIGFKEGLCPVAEAQYNEIITLPVFPLMTDADADDVIAAVKKVCHAYAK
jgi:perosamine synthetase